MGEEVKETLDILQLFPTSYEEALDLQLDLVEKRASNAVPDTLILTEHPPVFTCGRRTRPESRPQSPNIPVVEVTRGGDITYHGPGQLVGYWIRKLEGRDRDLHAHLRLIEDCLMEALAALSLEAHRQENLTGVWSGKKKIASIGVAVRHWITFHGFALNIQVDHTIYDQFRPCGLSGQVMSDLAALLSPPPRRDHLTDLVCRAFRQLYARED